MKKARPNRGRPLVRSYQYAPSNFGQLAGWLDTPTNLATYKFANGRLYEYPNTPLELFQQLVNAPDRDAFFQTTLLRPPGHPLGYTEVFTDPVTFDVKF